MIGIVLLVVLLLFIITDTDNTVSYKVKLWFRDLFLFSILLTFIIIVKFYIEI